MRADKNNAQSNIVEGHFGQSTTAKISSANGSSKVLATEFHQRSITKIAVEKQKRSQFLVDLSQAVELNFCDPGFGIDELAYEIGISKQKLVQQCQEYVFIAPVEFLKEFRLNEAARLLSEDEPLNEIAFRTGFASHKEFCQYFEIRFGRTPSQQIKLESHRYGVL